MAWSVGTKVGLGVVTALAIVAAVDVVSHAHLTGLLRASSTLTRTYELLDDLDLVLLHLQNAETGQRGYLLTGEEPYLEPYESAVRNIDADIDQLKGLLDESDRQSQRDRFDQLRSLIGEKLSELDETIQARRTQGFEAASLLVRTNRGKAIMDRIRGVIDEMRAEETDIRRQQQAAVESSARSTIGILGVGSALGLLLLIVAGVIIHLDVAARRKARDEQARLEASLRHSETMSAMGSLVAGVAHEVRNPLFGISSALDAMEARLGRREEYASYVTILRGELERLTRLMKQLLDYGKPTNLTFEPASIEDVVNEAAQSSQALAYAGDVRIKTLLPSELTRVSIDSTGLLHVVHNILENAIQHSPPGASVTVRARPVEGSGRRWVDLAVEDLGPGFAPADLPHVLDPFFSRRPGGTGLGLAIAQRIVEGYGGRISAENGPAGGAQVVVRLPSAAGGAG